MLLGHSAGAAAVIALDQEIAVQDVSYEQLKKKLIKGKQVLEI
ncbi:MAG: hypothetical protein ACOCXH_07635 [Cyclobacteriaceae bacterium]